MKKKTNTSSAITSHLHKPSSKSTGRKRKSLVTSQPLVQPTQPTLLQEDSPAKTSVTPVPGLPKESLLNKESGEKEVVSGRKWQGLSRQQSPSSWSLKTSQHSSKKDSELSYEICTQSGTMRNGKLFLPLMWAPHTLGSDASLWLTPSASDGSKRASFSAKSLAKRFDKHPNGNLAEQYAKKTGKRLCPNLLEYLMGYPENYTMLNESNLSEILSSPK